MKRILSLLLFAALLMTLLTACATGTEDGQAETDTAADTTSPASENASTTKARESSAKAEDGLIRRGKPVLGYMDLPVMEMTATSNADEIPQYELRSEYDLYTFNASDYPPQQHPDDALLIKMERGYQESVEHFPLDYVAQIYGQYETFGDSFDSWAIEDRTVDGHAAKLVKFEKAQKDMGICLTGDNMYRYIWVDVENTDCFLVQFIWNPDFGEYDVEKYISSYRLAD